MDNCLYYYGYMLTPKKVNNSFFFETALSKEEDHREVITHTLIPTNILNKSALPYLYWTNDGKYIQIWSSTGLQQEIQNLFPFCLATKHSIFQDHIYSIRLAEYSRRQLQEEKKFLDTSHGVFNGVYHPLQLFSHVAIYTKQQCFSVAAATASARERRSRLTGLDLDSADDVWLISSSPATSSRAASVHRAIENIAASVHSLPQDLDLTEHPLVCDVPPLCLLDDDVHSQHNTM